MDAEPSALFSGYQPPGDVFDEMAAENSPRAHWKKLVASLERLAPDDLPGRLDTATRMLREDGVTYNVYGHTRGLGRPWALDLVPLIIPRDEWRGIEAGLAQRARLLNRVLADAYGPRQLIRDGTLPAHLLFANPSFLRACDGFVPPKNIFLFLHAVDLARAPDGQWWVLSERTQAPSGAGYALENRLVLSRVMPDEYREGKVERLAGFFQIMRDTLRGLLPNPNGQPNVVLLTPGPYNETYFEHVYLSRYLGFPLVEGADLTVRDRRVFLKTLEGLQPVDVILRRADDTFCDPLELRADSFLGVPGLLEAARAGNVAVANALGTGMVETPALAAFLPGLARTLLDEELRLPSVATWWCGQEKEFSYVRDHLGELVIKRAFSRNAAGPVFGGHLNPEERSELLSQMVAEPHDYVAQEQIALSTAPVFDRGRLQPRPVVLRTYVCATGDGYAVMPGGLARFSTAPERLVVSMQSGGGSKDVWITSEGAVNPITLMPARTQVVRLERAAAELPSRVADNLFWLGRYAERLEDTVRTLRCLLVRLTEEETEATPELQELIRLLVDVDLFPARFRERFTLASVEREVYSLIQETHRLGALRELIGRMNPLAFALRDRFSADTWRILNQLQFDARPEPGRISISDALELMNTMIVNLAAFAGMEMENMTRGHGWRFLDIGRRLERAVNVTTLVQAGFPTEPNSPTLLEPILEIADSVMTYRRRYFAQPQWPTGLDLLLADEANPRSLAFQVVALSKHLEALPRDATRADDAERRPMELLRELLRNSDFTASAEAHLNGGEATVGAVLARITAELRGISDGLTRKYFSHATTQTS